MPTAAASTMKRLLDFNRQVLDQALAVVAEHAVPGAPPFADTVGRHLRHVVEHYEALVIGLPLGLIDYDDRPRDRRLEASPGLARDRLVALRQLLGRWSLDLLEQPVQVRGQGGITGNFGFEVNSSVGRELVFLASHAVHHFALLAEHLRCHDIPVPAYFGRAPSTVANDLATHRATAPSDNQELSCPSLVPSA